MNKHNTDVIYVLCCANPPSFGPKDARIALRDALERMSHVRNMAVCSLEDMETWFPTAAINARAALLLKGFWRSVDD